MKFGLLIDLLELVGVVADCRKLEIFNFFLQDCEIELLE